MGRIFRFQWRWIKKRKLHGYLSIYKEIFRVFLAIGKSYSRLTSSSIIVAMQFIWRTFFLFKSIDVNFEMFVNVCPLSITVNGEPSHHPQIINWNADKTSWLNTFCLTGFGKICNADFARDEWIYWIGFLLLLEDNFYLCEFWHFKHESFFLLQTRDSIKQCYHKLTQFLGKYREM